MSLSGVAMRQEKSENDDTQVIISRLLACSKESRYMTCLVLTHLTRFRLLGSCRQKPQQPTL